MFCSSYSSTALILAVFSSLRLGIGAKNTIPAYRQQKGTKPRTSPPSEHCNVAENGLQSRRPRQEHERQVHQTLCLHRQVGRRRHVHGAKGGHEQRLHHLPRA
ncbi:hypothetical protein MAPG_07804 [Magnaporthiopsis poae ATCC 64411]|uniref:Secreted protein n=1 Tax=Magnaporthiopsis poae (strain ATCC 64411 / 73-15) TaxID=644358 RepID=A0A0C4E5N1_MAGP6|nr:hypothetical protein MAPG_07804 [Magnaporthiopsis poae ATCC 64411]